MRILMSRLAIIFIGNCAGTEGFFSKGMSMKGSKPLSNEGYNLVG